MARPEKPVDWKKVEELLMAGCLGTEIASYFDMHPNTFYAKVELEYNLSFTQFSAEKKAKGESILRAHQYAKALGLTDRGDNTLLIWLGKQRLGQREQKEDHTQQQKVIFEVNYSNESTKSTNDKVTISPTQLSTTDTTHAQ